MAKQSRTPVVAAQINVISDVPGSVTVRAVAPTERMNDARPLAGFYIRRRYHNDEFALSDWRQFSKRWMEFVDEPPEDWVKAMELDEVQKAELMAKAIEEDKQAKAEPLMFALSQMLGGMGVKKPGDFDYSSGRMKDPQGI
jgi:hypothetical protein